MTTQYTFDFPHRPAFGAEDFLVAASNAEAIAWLDRWPDWPSPSLIVYGPPGCGKTHLAHVWRGRSGARAIAPDALTIENVPELIGSASPVVVDDADTAAERPLLHLVNLMAERGDHLLLTAREPPLRWPAALPDLRSRLLAMQAAAVQSPDDALIGGVLQKLFADRQILVSDEVALFLLSHMERSFAAARRIVAALDRTALAARRAITLPLAREVLAREALGEDQSSS
jgi:chromosomal replication initiation ATPase DnaA